MLFLLLSISKNLYTFRLYIFSDHTSNYAISINVVSIFRTLLWWWWWSGRNLVVCQSPSYFSACVFTPFKLLFHSSWSVYKTTQKDLNLLDQSTVSWSTPSFKYSAAMRLAYSTIHWIWFVEWQIKIGPLGRFSTNVNFHLNGPFCY